MAKLGRYSADRKKVESLTANKTVTVADCGTLFMLNNASGLSGITLPAAAKAGNGWWAHFIVATDAGSNDYVIDAANSGEIIALGFFNKVNTDGGSDGDISAATAKITFDGSADMKLGDKVELYCDGSKFYAYAFSADQASIVFA
mgnify:CR=1 FL=1